MLEVYKKLFLKLYKEGLEYVVYKGLNHLEEDINGERGDLDILVPFAELETFDLIVKNLGFNRVKTSSMFPVYYMSRDEKTGAFVMLDVDVDIRLGSQLNKGLSFTPETKSLLTKCLVFDDIAITVLDDLDYFPLMLLIRITMQNPSDESFQEIKILQSQLAKEAVQNSYFGALVNRINPSLLSFDKSSWIDLQNAHKNEVLEFLSENSSIKKRQQSNKNKSLKEAFRKVKRIFGQPAAFAHKGYIVAFVGVDGSGKSSAIDRVLDDKYFQITGLKRIYFGGNEFMIPGILRLYQWLESTPSLRMLRAGPSFIMQIDRKIRLLKALYYKKMGNIVLCDRYYYDDELMREYVRGRISRKEGLKVLNKLQLFTLPRVLVKPDLTFFLDVSPEVAYSRKQDFSFNAMLKVNKDYRELMSKRKEVLFINADEEQVKVQSRILRKIKELSDRKNEYGI